MPALAGFGLGGVLPGLTASSVGGGFDLSPAAFACCGGSGLRPCDGRVEACDLRARVRGMAALTTQYARDAVKRANDRHEEFVWPGPALEPDPRFLRACLERIAALGAGKAKKGYMYRVPEDKANLYALWSVALAAAWRFGVDVRFVRLGAGPLPAWVSGNQPAGPKGKAGPAMVFVDGVGKLWDTRLADDLEVVVGLAYRAGFPLWLALEGAATPDTSNMRGFGVQRALQQRLSRLKARSPLDWLTTDVRSKIAAVCEAPRSTAAKSQAARPTTTRSPSRSH